MSATRLLVLGVVRMYGRAHGYQVRHELLTWSADKWANVAAGSIYHALKKLAVEKLIEEVSEEGGKTRGPSRTAYRLTPDGETEFQSLLANSLAADMESRQGAYQFSAAVTLLPALPRAKAISLLRHRIVHLRGREAVAREMVEHESGWAPAHVAELYGLWLVNVRGLLNWLEQLVERLEAGRYVMADDDGTEFGAPDSVP